MAHSSKPLASCRKKTVLAIIPARGGSKGIPRKNIRPLCGKPLIGYTIETALKSKTIDHVVVSTEDEEIAEVSKSLGVDVPFLRPRHMAGDHASLSPVIDYTVKQMRKRGVTPDMIVTLYPTSPFRTSALVDYLIAKMIEGYSTVRTVKSINVGSLVYFTLKQEKRLDTLLESGCRFGPTALRRYYRSYGLFLGISDNSRPYLHLIKNPVSLIDIDLPEDFFLAEEIIRNELFNFDSEDAFDCAPAHIHQ